MACSWQCSDADRRDRGALARGRGVGWMGTRLGEPAAARHARRHCQEHCVHRVSARNLSLLCPAPLLPPN